MVVRHRGTPRLCIVLSTSEQEIEISQKFVNLVNRRTVHAKPGMVRSSGIIVLFNYGVRTYPILAIRRVWRKEEASYKLWDCLGSFGLRNRIINETRWPVDALFIFAILNITMYTDWVNNFS